MWAGAHPWNYVHRVCSREPTVSPLLCGEAMHAFVTVVTNSEVKLFPGLGPLALLRKKVAVYVICPFLNVLRVFYVCVCVFSNLLI